MGIRFRDSRPPKLRLRDPRCWRRLVSRWLEASQSRSGGGDTSNHAELLTRVRTGDNRDNGELANQTWPTCPPERQPHVDGAWGRSPTCRSTESPTPWRARSPKKDVCPTLFPKVSFLFRLDLLTNHEPTRFMGKIAGVERVALDAGRTGYMYNLYANRSVYH